MAVVEQVSYQKRDCRDQAKIEQLLQTARTGIVGMQDDDYPYAVPVNFVWHKGAVYFHGMGSGKKVRLLMRKPSVCFTVYREDGTVTDPAPCHADTAYLSVMIFGEARQVTDFGESAAALQQILDKYTPAFYSQAISPRLVEKYRSAMDDNPVAVYRITPVQITAKENAVAPEALFNASSS